MLLVVRSPPSAEHVNTAFAEYRAVRRNGKRYRRNRSNPPIGPPIYDARRRDRALRAQARTRAGRGRRLAPHGPRRRHHAARAAARAAGAAGHRAARDAPAGRHRRRLRDQRQDDHGGDGGGHPRARRPALPQHGRRQPRLRRRLDAAGGARGRAARAARGRRVRAAGRRLPHVARGRCCSATCSATSSTATASSSSWPSAGALSSPGSTRGTRLVLGADDPAVGDLGDGRADAARLRHRRPGAWRATPSRTRPTRRSACAAAPPTPTTPSTSATSATTAARSCGHARPPLDLAARDVRLDGVEGSAFRLDAPDGSCEVRLGVPGLYNVENALGALALAYALGVPTADAAPSGSAGFRAAFGRFERLRAGDRDVVLLLIKNPAGANEALRTRARGRAREPAGARPQRPHRRRARRLLDLGRRLRGDAARAPRHVVATGTRAADLALRVALRRHRARDASSSSRTSSRRSTAGWSCAGAGGTAYVLPTYTAMLELQRLVERARPGAALLGGARVIAIVPLYPELLSIYADRGNVARARAAGALARARARRCGRCASATQLDPDGADVILIGGGQDRDQVLVADELRRQVPAHPRGAGPGRGAARRLRRLPAARPPLPRAPGRRDPRHRPRRPGDARRRHPDHRQRAGRLPLRRRAAQHGRLREPRRAHTLGPDVEPLGRVVAGGGNNGEDGTEGCRAGRIVGTYVHGPLLPKNGWLADALLAWALDRRGQPSQLGAARRRARGARGAARGRHRARRASVGLRPCPRSSSSLPCPARASSR